MLLERSQALAVEIEQFERLKGSADQAKRFEVRAAQFAAAAQQLSNMAAAMKNLRDAGVAVEFLPKDGAGLAERAAKLIVGFRSDPNSLNDPGFDIKYHFVDRLLAIAATGDEASLAAWQRYVKKNSYTAAEEILVALASIPDYRAIVGRIRAIRARLEAVAESVPSAPIDAIAEMNKITAEHRAAWSEMTAGDIPGPVIAFLRDCAADGASVATFTEEVKAWFSNRNLLHVFRIKIR
jgi:hypothetical protein